MNDDYDGGQANEPVSYSIKLSCALHKVIKKEIVSEKTPDAVGYVKIPSKNMTSNIVLFFLKTCGYFSNLDNCINKLTSLACNVQ